jgi:hypothetical protein
MVNIRHESQARQLAKIESDAAGIAPRVRRLAGAARQGRAHPRFIIGGTDWT